MARLPKVSGSSVESDKIFLSGRMNRVLTHAEDEAKKAKDQYIAPEHVLLGLVEDDGMPPAGLLRPAWA